MTATPSPPNATRSPSALVQGVAKRIVGGLRCLPPWQSLRCAIGRARGTRQQRKLLILSTGRSGSTVLVDYLASHPQIRCFGEVLNPDSVIYGDPRGRSRGSLLRGLEALVTAPPNRWAGIKILTHQFEPIDLDLADVLDHLRPHVIVLYRRNLLDWYASVRIGQTNRQWTSTQGANKVGCEFDEDTWRDFIAKNRELWQELSGPLRDWPQRKVLAFEDLSADPEATMREVFAFLGLEPCALRTRLVRQNPQPIEEKIVNYRELDLDQRLAGETELDLEDEFGLSS